MRDGASKHFIIVTDDMYETWLVSLLQAVRECDPEISDEIEEQWRIVMREGIDQLLGRASTAG